MRIRNAEDLTQDQLWRELERGGRLVVFHWVLSVLILSFRFRSPVYFIRAGENAASSSMPYTLLTLLLGWWGVPFGPIFSIGALITNLRGGSDGSDILLPLLSSSAARVAPPATSASAVGNGAVLLYTRKDESSAAKGPFESRSVAQALQAGHLSPRSQVREEGSETWVLLKDHPLFRHACSP